MGRPAKCQPLVQKAVVGVKRQNRCLPRPREQFAGWRAPIVAAGAYGLWALRSQRVAWLLPSCHSISRSCGTLLLLEPRMSTDLGRSPPHINIGANCVHP
jgi:hypothetical protein